MKTKKDHKVPLTAQMLNLLELLKPLNGQRKHLFPAVSKPNEHANSSTVNVALKRMGFKGRLTSHGLRALGRATIGEGGQRFEHSAMEACLSHRVGTQVSLSYDRATYLEERVVIMDWWSKQIEKASIGNISLSGRNLKTYK